MTNDEALAKAEKINKHLNLSAKVVRILSSELDPIKLGDSGWDVEVSVLRLGKGFFAEATLTRPGGNLLRKD